MDRKSLLCGIAVTTAVASAVLACNFIVKKRKAAEEKRRIIDKAFSQETLDRIKELTKKFFPDSSIFADDCRDSGIRRVLLFTNSPHALPGVGAKFRNTLGSVLGNLTDHLHVEILP